ncbi:MAG: hypothetical protein DRP74_04780 [Candidatus Omnitrophota bacterium]|nr:MAG: hypothetical protein DRP74_04780 [Candidatus Omnitrophota bacterium]
MGLFEFIYELFRIASFFIILFLAIILLFKIEKVKQLQEIINNLRKSLEEMDEQAKLILRTDMELNKAQEELDKKISSLYALQKISRTISTTLEESQIFRSTGSVSFEELGFEKACALLWDENNKKFVFYLVIGYKENEIEAIKSYANSENNTLMDLIKRGKAFSSISLNPDNPLIKATNEAFKVNSFIVCPLLTEEFGNGLFFIGTQNTELTVTAGDEELITILANQIAQAIENARLFEKAWKSQQELERKVEERTRQLSRALEEVKIISDRKTNFISSVSHELRTPLTSIKGYAAILLEEKLGALPQAVKERLAKINRHSDELVHMVNDLLDIARIESGRTTMKLAEQDLNNIVSSVSDLIFIQYKNKNVDLVTDIQKDIPPILVDRSQIERVFINLLGNAIKFTPEKGQVTIKAREVEEDKVQIDISDTGIGLPAESSSKIFEEFYRVDNSINQQVKGTGLGLSLVRQIIEAHKGKIWVKSKVGEGSTFSFLLPLVK